MTSQKSQTQKQRHNRERQRCHRSARIAHRMLQKSGVNNVVQRVKRHANNSRNGELHKQLANSFTTQTRGVVFLHHLLFCHRPALPNSLMRAHAREALRHERRTPSTCAPSICAPPPAFRAGHPSVAGYPLPAARPTRAFAKQRPLFSPPALWTSFPHRP